MRKLLIAVLCAALGAVVLPQSAAAIVGGTPDGEEHPNVGLLAFDVDGAGETPPFALCTGVVISDSAFLTAAHCIDAAVGAQWVVSLKGGSPGDLVSESGVVWDDFPFAVTAPVYRATDVVVHPDYVAGQARRNDLAVLVFPEGTFAGIVPVELPALHYLDLLKRGGELQGEPVALVGYGVNERLGPQRFLYPGYRQQGDAAVQGLTQDWLLVGAASAAAGGPALCLGDSGSPQYLGDTDVVVSIYSRSGTTCNGIARAQRLDTASAQEFLASFI